MVMRVQGTASRREHAQQPCHEHDPDGSMHTSAKGGRGKLST
jgi:hypothetical protein